MVIGYPLPACPVLLVRDLTTASAWYVGGLGFQLVFSSLESLEPHDHHDEPLLAHLRWGERTDLVLTGDPPQPAEARGLGVTLRFTVAGNVDALADRARAYGVDVAGPVDRPWKTREITVHDPDGYRLVFTGRQEDGGQPVQKAAAAELPGKAVVRAR